MAGSVLSLVHTLPPRVASDSSGDDPKIAKKTDKEKTKPKKEKHTRATETKTKKTTKKRKNDDDEEEEDDVDHDHVPLLGKRDDDDEDGDGVDSDEDIPKDLKPKRGATKKPASAKGGPKKRPSTKRHKQDTFFCRKLLL